MLTSPEQPRIDLSAIWDSLSFECKNVSVAFLTKEEPLKREELVIMSQAQDIDHCLSELGSYGILNVISLDGIDTSASYRYFISDIYRRFVRSKTKKKS